MDTATEQSGPREALTLTRPPQASQRRFASAGHTARRAEDVLSGHGRAAFAMACALLGDEEKAVRATALGIVDLACSPPVAAAGTRRALARRVYWRCEQIAGGATSVVHQPASMATLRQLAQLQRTCLALCVFGGHTYREAANLLGVPPLTVARSLTSGLKELGHLPADATVVVD
jgi:Sigma-70, region 4